MHWRLAGRAFLLSALFILFIFCFTYEFTGEIPAKVLDRPKKSTKIKETQSASWRLGVMCPFLVRLSMQRGNFQVLWSQELITILPANQIGQNKWKTASKTCYFFMK